MVPVPGGVESGSGEEVFAEAREVAREEGTTGIPVIEESVVAAEVVSEEGAGEVLWLAKRESAARERVVDTTNKMMKRQRASFVCF